jgi:hypothetical protein
MAQSDLRTFLQDLLLRFQPDIDLSEGGRAQVEIIEPIITRIGIDPFDTDIATFVQSRVAQMFPDLAIEDTQALEDTLISPMQVLMEPLVREIKLAKLRQGGVANVESLSDDEIDSLMGNFFESRQAGGYSRGTIRIWFLAPQTVTFSLIQVATTRSGLRFVPSPTQTITSSQMALNRDGNEYYVDITYRAEKRGDEYNIDRNEITSIANLPSAARIRNVNRFQGGLPRETSIDFVGRVETTLSDRTLTVQRGILSELKNNFPAIRSIQVIGMKDPEMERDIVKGGSLGEIRPDDSFGSAYGSGTAIDDGDGNTTTRRISATDGHFVSRIGSAGSEPDGYYVTLVYGSPPVFKDVQVTEVISDTDILVDIELPSFPLSVSWALRKKELTISDIPGGITLPDTPDGELVITSDEVHIGGKTDVYLAGETSEETVAIEGLSDEEPLAMGFDAETVASPGVDADWIVINDPTGGAAALLASIEGQNYSIVLSEGVDIGSYAIRDARVDGTTVEVRVPVEMTGTQGGISWKIVNEISVELTEPKDIKVDGEDMVLVAGNNSVTTLSSTNFIDANVQQNDTLRLEGDFVGGDYNIDAVGPVQLTISPTPERTVSNVRYTIFRAGEAVQTPVVRVKELQLLDSGGAPNGVVIPYRDPVVVMTRGFQNEGSGLTYEGFPDRIGLVTGALGATVAFGAGQTLIFNFRNATRPYAGQTATHTLNLVGSLTPAQIVSAINADVTLAGRSVFASLISYNGQSFVGIYCPEWVQMDLAGTANVSLGFNTADRPSTNIEIVISAHNPREGDLIEFVDGNNRGTTRVLFRNSGTATSFLVGSGPVSDFTTPLYAVTPLLPEVGVRIRIGRPSVGSARVYFLDPTSAEFHYDATRLTTLVGTDLLEYRPDPENQRIVQPAPPLTELPKGGETSTGSVNNVFGDTEVNFQALGVRDGDILEVLYRPITSTAALSSPGTIAGIIGQTLILRLAENPWITVSFSVALTRDDIAEFINEQVGEEIATIDGSGYLVLEGDVQITIRDDSTILGGSDPLLLAGAPRSTAHPRAGRYIITDVEPNTLTLSPDTVFASTTAVADTAYRIVRHVQRISSTEMNDNQDGTGLYYVDVELLSLAPGDRNNAPANLSMEITGHVSDGYRLYTDNDTLSYSRAERLFAEISRTILLVGSSDSPEEYVQLSQQNVQVSYDRSQLVDDVQSFCDSDDHRVVVEEILARHLLPHYVNITWRYAGGETEVSMRTALTTYLDAIGSDEELEIVDMTKVMTSRGATSIYNIDSESPTGRSAPILVIIYHTIDRQMRALLVRDYAKTSRTQRFIADDLAIVRIAPGGIRA